MRIVTILLAAFFLLLPWSGTTKAQDQPITCRDWFAIQSWGGTITISGSGASSDQLGNSASISESATITFATDRSTSPCDVNDLSNAGNGWTAANTQVTYSVSLHDEYQESIANDPDSRESFWTQKSSNWGTVAGPMSHSSCEFRCSKSKESLVNREGGRHV